MDREIYLQEEQHYIDLHDLHTIEMCLDYGRSLYSKLPEILKDPKLKDLTEEKKKNDWLRSINIVVYSIKISRFKEKKSTIEEWMGRDREKQDRFDNASEEVHYCPNDDVLLEVFMKSLHNRMDEDLKVLFFYKCPRCNYREGWYDTGEKYESKPTLCEKCGSEIDVDLKIDDKKDTTTWTYACTGCDYKEVTVEDHKEWKQEHEAKEKSDKELLEKYRKEFCFSEKEGNEAVMHMEQMSRLVDDLEEKKKKSEDPAYKKAKSLKKLKVIEVNKLLKEKLAESGYVELQFEKPEMGRFVAVPFVVQDEKTNREDYDSKKELKKLIDSVLLDSNWRLMSDGISYRVGYLNGRLRCYESEDELAKIISV